MYITVVKPSQKLLYKIKLKEQFSYRNPNYVRKTEIPKNDSPYWVGLSHARHAGPIIGLGIVQPCSPYTHGTQHLFAHYSPAGRNGL